MPDLEGVELEIDHPADLEHDQPRPRIVEGGAKGAGTIAGERRHTQDDTTQTSVRDVNWFNQSTCRRGRLFGPERDE